MLLKESGKGIPKCRIIYTLGMIYVNPYTAAGRVKDYIINIFISFGYYHGKHHTPWAYSRQL